MMSVQEIINPKYIDQHAIVRDSFINGNPFKHFLFTDFLQDSFLDSILVEFPVPPDLNALKNEFGQSNRRHAVHKIIDLGPTFQAWDELLKSEKFIRWLCNVTGIPGLLYDPEYHGAGTHNNLHGQDLDVHVDFNLHRTTGFHRRLNLIIYLNKGWQPEWGGGLSLHKNPWDPEEDESIVYP
ncbi:MAG: 2OG-Fe(II) oxygenase, partial [Saprospiraceae bacterium]|nr:2OG-Fe(II) oxygenase [Saprospiraceae bacterium]